MDAQINVESKMVTGAIAEYQEQYHIVKLLPHQFLQFPQCQFLQFVETWKLKQVNNVMMVTVIQTMVAIIVWSSR